MELKPKDTYRVYLTRDLSSSDLESLMTLYQPLIGGDAVLVYLTLASESKNTHTAFKHARLFNIMNMIQIDTFLHARRKLEEYMLLRTYVKQTDTKNVYVYQMHSPLSPRDFLSTNIYANRYIQTAGKKTFDESNAKYEGCNLHPNEFKEITVSMKNVKEEDYNNTVVYTNVKPRYQFNGDDIQINFDYEHFFATTSSTVFPSDLRTQENLAYIGRLATLYGLDADTMRVKVSKSVSIEKNTLNTERLKFLCEMSKPAVVKSKDPYDLPPISFLISKQNGAAVSMNDKKILERLSLDMHFPSPVINIMIEYILKISDNRLNNRFVDMVSGEWARDGITTKEQAIQQTKKVIHRNTSYRLDTQIEMPEYMKRQEQGTIQSTPVDQDTLAKALELQKKMRGK